MARHRVKVHAVKKKRIFLMEEKRDIIRRIQKGEKITAVARDIGVNQSTISTMWLNREKILEKAKTVAKGVKFVSNESQRHPLHDKMEKLLLLFMTEMDVRGTPVSGEQLKFKALEIWDKLVKMWKKEQEEEGEEDHPEPFDADDSDIEEVERVKPKMPTFTG